MESKPSSSAPQGPRLLDTLRGEIRRRHYSRRTEEAYTYWTKRFIYFHGKRSPSELGEIGNANGITRLFKQPENIASRISCAAPSGNSAADLGTRGLWVSVCNAAGLIAQFRAIPVMLQRFRIRECFDIFHWPAVDDVAHGEFDDLAALGALDSAN